MRLWELGQFLPQFRHVLKDYLKTGTPPETVDKKIIEATVSRYKRKATESIGNTALGIFP